MRERVFECAHLCIVSLFLHACTRVLLCYYVFKSACVFVSIIESLICVHLTQMFQEYLLLTPLMKDAAAVK